jgi:hypothetical protein
MKKYNNLLQNIASEWTIPMGQFEDELSFKSRVIYSVLGRMACVAVYDVTEDLQPASIVHVKRRIDSVLAGYLTMYPELALVFSDAENLHDEIYDILLSSGQIYHTPNRVSPAVMMSSAEAGIVFTRGISPSQKTCISGIGTYDFSQESYVIEQSPEGMFQLQQDSLLDYWAALTRKLKWTSYQSGSDTEYLRTEPPFSRGYWVDKPDRSGNISLCRSGMMGNYLYYLYRWNDGIVVVSQLAAWKVEKCCYRNISNSCLVHYGNLPVSTFHIDGELVNLNISYLYPPAELNFVKVYSWPKVYTGLPSDFNRTMSLCVFSSAKSILERIGYQFSEV